MYSPYLLFNFPVSLLLDRSDHYLTLLFLWYQLVVKFLPAATYLETTSLRECQLLQVCGWCTLIGQACQSQGETSLRLFIYFLLETMIRISPCMVSKHRRKRELTFQCALYHLNKELSPFSIWCHILVPNSGFRNIFSFPAVQLFVVVFFCNRILPWHRC